MDKDNLRGAGLMVLSQVAFTCNDVLLKLAGAHVPLFQAIFLRSLITLLGLIALTHVLGKWPRSVPARDQKFIAGRTLCELAAAYFFLTALFNMPISDATAILQVLPLSVALAGAVFLKEPIGRHRIVAILVGFVGVLMIVQPGMEGFTIFALYAVAAVIAVTIRDIFARQISAEVPSVFVATIGAGVIGAGFGLATLALGWAPMTAPGWLLLSGASVFILGAYIFSVATMRLGEIGFVTPFRYTGILAALIFGIVVFGERPNALMLMGLVLVVASGLYTLYRERRATSGA